MTPTTSPFSADDSSDFQVYHCSLPTFNPFQEKGVVKGEDLMHQVLASGAAQFLRPDLGHWVSG